MLTGDAKHAYHLLGCMCTYDYARPRRHLTVVHGPSDREWPPVPAVLGEDGVAGVDGCTGVGQRGDNARRYEDRGPVQAGTGSFGQLDGRCRRSTVRHGRNLFDDGSGGRVLSTKTRRSANRAAALLRIAAVNIGKTQTALGAFYRRLAARVGKAKAVTATARKLAVLFYNALRHGMTYADPGADYYEERHRQRVVHNLQRRARQLGFVLVQDAGPSPGLGVS